MSPRAISRALDWTDRATCVLFGDGAGAAVMEAGGENPLAVELSTAPDVETLRVPGLDGTSPFKVPSDRQSVLSMNGRRVFKFGVNAICDTVHKLASDAGISVEDIDHFVFHQANERILSQAVKRLPSTGWQTPVHFTQAAPSPWLDLAPVWI